MLTAETTLTHPKSESHDSNRIYLALPYNGPNETISGVPITDLNATGDYKNLKLLICYNESRDPGYVERTANGQFLPLNERVFLRHFRILPSRHSAQVYDGCWIPTSLHAVPSRKYAGQLQGKLAYGHGLSIDNDLDHLSFIINHDLIKMLSGVSLVMINIAEPILIPFWCFWSWNGYNIRKRGFCGYTRSYENTVGTDSIPQY